MKKYLLLLQLFLLPSCQGDSPCKISVENFGKYLIVKVQNISDKTVTLAAQGHSISFAVKKKMGSWTYDMNNMTKRSGHVKLIAGEEKTIRKFISKYDKQLKYKLELICNGDKVETEEF